MKMAVGGALCVLSAGLVLFLWSGAKPVPAAEPAGRAALSGSMPALPSHSAAANAPASPPSDQRQRTGASASERLRSVRAARPGAINWGQFTAGLGAFAATALGTGNGADALLAARALKECRTVQHVLDFTLEQLQTTSDPVMREIWTASNDEAQMRHRQCQTVPGDADELRVQLLNLAMGSAVEGASAELLMDYRYFDRADLPDGAPARAVKDALAGDLMSLAYLASRELGSPVAPADQILAARLALMELKESKADEQGPRPDRIVGMEYFFEAIGQLTSERARRDALPRDHEAQRTLDFPERPASANIRKLRDELLVAVRSRLPKRPL